MTKPHIRAAEPRDVPQILQMIRDLAEYERAADQVLATTEQLTAALFGPEPAVFAHVLDLCGDHPVPEPNTATGTTSDDVRASNVDGECPLGGFAIWFLNFSTWLGRHGLYLEDLYVRPELRGQGHGQALLATLAQLCVERGYGRLEWWVLDWNAPAIGFYRSLTAQAMDEWTVFRLTGDSLRAVAQHPSASGRC